MAVVIGFRERARATRAYLTSLADIENRIIGRPGRGFYQAAQTVAASRASAYIMIYNCVEYAVREAIVAIRRDVQSAAPQITDLKPYWRHEILRAQFGSKLRNGCNIEQFLKEIGDFLPGTIEWGPAETEIPFNGNIDHLKLLKFAKDIGARRWVPPPTSLGGNDLLAIKNARNELAHGEESFESIGSSCTTTELIQRFDRVRVFTLSFLSQVEHYRANRLYLDGGAA